MKHSRLLLFAALLVLLSQPASAFDGQRSGFVLGGGLGPGVLNSKVELSSGSLSAESDLERDFSLVSDFRIGAGVSDQWVLLYSSRTDWFWPVDAQYTFTHGVGTLGVLYYFEPTAPSTYVTGGIGLSSLDLPFEDVDALQGLGIRLGIGREFNPHWSMELGVTYGRPSDDSMLLIYDEGSLDGPAQQNLHLRYDLFSVHFVAVGMAY